MALARFQFQAVDQYGNVLPGASIEVRREGAGQPLAALYLDRSGLEPLGNPFTADGEGFAYFHAAGGAFQIKASKDGYERIWRWVGVGTLGEADNGSVLQAANNLSDVASVATARANLELGRNSRSIPSGNFDLAVDNGWYWSLNTDTNGPSLNFYILEVVDANGATKLQRATYIGDGSTYVRIYKDWTATWGSWVRIASANFAVLLPDVSSNISVGFTITPYNAGTKSSGTFTPAPASGNYQYATNNGAHTIAAPSSDCAIDILYTNGASAGAVTFSGFTVGSSTGSALSTTNTHKFIISIRRINSVATYSIYALQ